MSFWSKITGSISADEYDDLFDEPHDSFNTPQQHTAPRRAQQQPTHLSAHQQGADTTSVHPSQHEDDRGFGTMVEETVQMGELAVDVYETQTEVVVKALVAGVQPSNVDINLTRDMITVQGTREEHKEAEDGNYFHKELFWGGFSRSIVLPEEVDVDAADASIAHGILLIRLPKVNKEKKTKLKVRAR